MSKDQHQTPRKPAAGFAHLHKKMQQARIRGLRADVHQAEVRVEPVIVEHATRTAGKHPSRTLPAALQFHRATGLLDAGKKALATHLQHVIDVVVELLGLVAKGQMS